MLDLIAFDTVSHHILTYPIFCLSSKGIMGSALSWFTSYLTDRQFKSFTCSLSQSVPQGSVLGPLQYLFVTPWSYYPILHFTTFTILPDCGQLSAPKTQSSCFFSGISFLEFRFSPTAQSGFCVV